MRDLTLIKFINHKYDENTKGCVILPGLSIADDGNIIWLFKKNYAGEYHREQKIYRNKTLISIINYSNGELKGLQKNYSLTNKLERVAYYSNGVIKWEYTWYDFGNFYMDKYVNDHLTKRKILSLNFY